eukprot:1390166-Pleurochrysis_carterae.AAC.4
MVTYGDYLPPLLRHAWAACMAEDAATCAETLSQVRAEHSLKGTGFTKATIALNNPTPVHNDHGNIGQTFLMCHDVSAGKESLSGGAHVLVDAEFAKAY